MLFASLKTFVNRFRKAPESPRWCNLTEGQIQQLRLLSSMDGYDLWLSLLDDITSLNAEAFLAPGMSNEQLHFARGNVAGLRRAATLVDEIIKEANRARPPAANPSDELAARRAALWGTPGWNPAT